MIFESTLNKQQYGTKITCIEERGRGGGGGGGGSGNAQINGKRVLDLLRLGDFVVENKLHCCVGSRE